MTGPPRFSLVETLRNAEETTAFGQRLAGHLRPGHTILIDGPLGAGKTHFARAVIQACLAPSGYTEVVPSPTFTLVQVYEGFRGQIWHVDLYRLSGTHDVVELGLDEAFETSICLVEWPGRLGDDAPVSAAVLKLVPTGVADERRAELSASDRRWAEVFSALGRPADAE